jgi:hypothetical protein
MEEVWARTQRPELHERWDLRFTSIRYLPKPSPSAPQRFLYSTRIGFGLHIDGEGESVGERDGASGERTSALRFWSHDRRSLIREGRGYWKYIPAPDGVTFLTWYDYDARFGAAGRALDRAVFRPVLGWATAWSFDRLRRWIEDGVDPGAALRVAAAHAIARLTLAFVFLYHGLVPKLLFRHADEIAMLDAAGAPDAAGLSLVATGVTEVALAIALLLRWRAAWPLWIVLAGMAAAAFVVGLTSPGTLTAAFNPVTLNTAVAALAGVALAIRRDVPTAARCRRRPA